MKFEKVGFMTPGDMGQAVAMQIKAVVQSLAQQRASS